MTSKAKDQFHKGLQEVRRLVAALHADAAQRAELAGNLRKGADESSCDASTKVLFNCKGAVRLVSLRTSPGTGTAIRILAPGPAWSYRL
jgi:signal transduction histidine kinase